LLVALQASEPGTRKLLPNLEEKNFRNLDLLSIVTAEATKPATGSGIDELVMSGLAF